MDDFPRRYPGHRKLLTIQDREGGSHEVMLRVQPVIDEEAWLDFELGPDHPRREEYLKISRPTDPTAEEVRLCAEIGLPVEWWVEAFEQRVGRWWELGPFDTEERATTALEEWAAEPPVFTSERADEPLA